MSYSNYNQQYRRSGLSEPSQLTAVANLWTPTSAQKNMLGMIYETDDGRRFRYCENGAGTLVAANINQAALEIANWVDEPQTVSGGAVVAAVGDEVITLLVQTAPTANIWDNGILWVENGDGEGMMYIIKSHTLTTNPKVTLADAGGIRVATVDGTDISIHINMFKDTIIFPTDPTQVCTGVNPVIVAANEFYWAQTKGPCVVMNGTDAIITGDEVCAGGQAAGVLSLPDAATPQEGDVTVGYAMRAAASGEAALIYLNIE